MFRENSQSKGVRSETLIYVRYKSTTQSKCVKYEICTSCNWHLEDQIVFLLFYWNDTFSSLQHHLNRVVPVSSVYEYNDKEISL